MRTAISLVLATALVTTPIKMVLAQAAQQEAVSVQRTTPPDSSDHRLIGVPPVTDNTSRLWGTPSDRALLNTELAAPLTSKADLGFLYQENEEEGGSKTVMWVVVAVVLVIVLGAVIISVNQVEALN